MPEEGPAIAVARSGACTPWISGAAIEALPWVKAAAEALIAKGHLDEGQLETICAEAAVAASDVLYELSGRVFTGQCGPVTVRPVARPTDADTRAWSSRFASVGWWASTSYSSGYGTINPGVMAHYGSQDPPIVQLPYPVREILQVKIDGVVIPPDEYELRGGRELVRLRVSASQPPTQRWGWPTSQITDLPDTESGTFSVTFYFGNPPPAMGEIAAVKLGEYLTLPQLGDNTRYPKRVTSFTRQGVSGAVVDVMDVLKAGASGIYEVDLFILTYNPTKQKRQAAVWSPDLGRPRRTAKPSLPA